MGNLLTGRGVNRAGKGCGIKWAGEGALVKSISEETKSTRQVRDILRAGYGSSSSKMDFKWLPHPLSNFELQRYY